MNYYKLLLFIPLLFCLRLEAQDTSFQATIDEINRWKTFAEEIKEKKKLTDREKANFSVKMANILTQKSEQADIVGLAKEVDEAWSKNRAWMKTLADNKERLDNLILVLEDAEKALADSGDPDAKKDVQAGKAAANELMTTIRTHVDFIQEYQGKVSSWKSFLEKKAKERLNQGLFKWKPYKNILSPNYFADSVQDLTNILFPKNFIRDLKYFLKNNFTVLFITLIFLIGILFGISMLTKNLSRLVGTTGLEIIPDDIQKGILTYLFEKKFLSLLTLFLLFFSSSAHLFGTGYPVNLHLLICILTLVVCWYQMIKGALIPLFKNYILKGYNLYYPSFPKWFPFHAAALIFLILQTFFWVYGTRNDYQVILGHGLLCVIAYFIMVVIRQVHVQESKESKSLFYVFRLFRFFSVFFLGILQGALMLEIAGFRDIGEVLQRTVTSSLTILTSSWIGYFIAHDLMMAMRMRLDRRKGKKNRYFYDVIGLVKQFVFLSITFGACLNILKKWLENIFVVTGFWQSRLIEFGDHALTLDHLVNIFVVYYIFRAFYLGLGLFTESFVLPMLNIPKKYSSNVLTLVKYSVFVIFLFTLSSILGFTLKNLLILASALGVGIGFGLQNIVNNFISGIILLFEQPIRMGDVIQVNDLFCSVRRIGIRSTMVTTLDNSCIIIPNSELLSNNLTNWTLNDNVMALNCTVGVAYGTDTEKVTEILKTTVKDDNDILEFPESQIWFEEFGDSSLNFKLKFWINDPLHQYVIKSKVMHNIAKALRENNVTIPFPQRDLHIIDHVKA